MHSNLFLLISCPLLCSDLIKSLLSFAFFVSLFLLLLSLHIMLDQHHCIHIDLIWSGAIKFFISSAWLFFFPLPSSPLSDRLFSLHLHSLSTITDAAELSCLSLFSSPLSSPRSSPLVFLFYSLWIRPFFPFDLFCLAGCCGPHALMFTVSHTVDSFVIALSRKVSSSSYKLYGTTDLRGCKKCWPIG